jgi:hypothetical protein
VKRQTKTSVQKQYLLKGKGRLYPSEDDWNVVPPKYKKKPFSDKHHMFKKNLPRYAPRHMKQHRFPTTYWKVKKDANAPRGRERYQNVFNRNDRRYSAMPYTYEVDDFNYPRRRPFGYTLGMGGMTANKYGPKQCWVPKSN